MHRKAPRAYGQEKPEFVEKSLWEVSLGNETEDKLGRKATTLTLEQKQKLCMFVSPIVLASCLFACARRWLDRAGDPGVLVAQGPGGCIPDVSNQIVVPKRYPLLLGVFTLLFLGRVAGQALVAFFDVAWLPPMERWFSGLLPYVVLLPVQVVILALMFRIVSDFARGYGYFVVPRPGAARFIKWFSCIYFVSMILRYVFTMWLQPEVRWFTGTIPIWFHMVLAAFLYAYSRFHLRATAT